MTTLVPVPNNAAPGRVASPADLAGLSPAELTAGVLTWAGRVAAGEAQLLAYISEFDERHVWSGTGITSCAHWLSWRLGYSLKTSLERVRVARALRTMPLTYAALHAGRLSYSQVRAITRVATPADEETYLRIAASATGSQLDRVARGVRRARHLHEAAQPGYVQPPVLTTRYDEDGSMLISIRVPAEDGAVILAALHAAQADLRDAAAAAAASSAEEPATPAAPGPKPNPAASPAEDTSTSAGAGLVLMARRTVQHQAREHPDRTRRDRTRLIVNVDPISGWARLPDGELLPPHTNLVPSGLGLRPLLRLDLTRHDSGRDQREPTQALRDLLGTLDGERCRIPGCTHLRYLHAHHIRWWSQGGPTDLDNLVLVCSQHHQAIHDGTLLLTFAPATRSLKVATEAGEVLPLRPELPWRPAAELDADQHFSLADQPLATYDRLDLGYAVMVLLQTAA